MRRGTIRLDRLRFLVFDEADKMFDMGFIDDIRQIIRNCPRERQTMLFSATISREVHMLVDKYMRNPQSVRTKDYV